MNTSFVAQRRCKVIKNQLDIIEANSAAPTILTKVSERGYELTGIMSYMTIKQDISSITDAVIEPITDDFNWE